MSSASTTACPRPTTPLTEGVTPNGQTLNVTTITSDLHQYGGWTPLTDVLQMTAIDNNVVQATRVLASQAGRTMDSITRDVLAGGTNVIYAPKLAADGTETAVTSRKALDKSCTLTPKLFFQAAAQLGAMNADPIGDSYIAIIHPYAAYDLKTCKEFIEAHKYADPDTMYRGEIGKLGNIRFIETSEAKIWKDATCPDGSGRLRHPGAGRPRLRRHRAGRRRPGAHRQAAGLRRRSAEPARLCGLEGYARRRASGGAVHGAHRERVQQLSLQPDLPAGRNCSASRVKGEAMAEKKNVRIRLFKDNSRYKGDLFVSVNGVNYKIRRGVEVEVPPEVAEVLEHSQQQDEYTAARIAAAETAAQ